METENKPFAPFGEVLHSLRKELPVMATCPFLFVGRNAYQDCAAMWNNGQIALCLPMGKKITDYRWSIKGLKVIVFDTGSMSAIGLTRISHDLLQQGVEVVCVHTELKQDVEIHKIKKELMNGKHKVRKSGHKLD